MTFNSTMTVGEVALAEPYAARVFEQAGIDYCCGGAQTLDAACAAAGVATEELLSRLAAASREQPAPDGTRALREASLTKVIAYIVDKHHVFTREELTRLDAFFYKVCAAHGENHPELYHLRSVFEELRQDLLIHMHKEEMMLFPYVIRMEDAISRGESIPPAMFATVRNPIRMMSSEHDAAGGLLREMRTASGLYVPPLDACASYRALYRALQDFEADLHQHIFLENSLLFPRAVEMEDRG